MLPILSFLRDLPGGKNGKTHEALITQENDQCYFNLPEGRFETHLVAEGYRKIATFTAKSDGFYKNKRVEAKAFLVDEACVCLREFTTRFARCDCCQSASSLTLKLLPEKILTDLS